MTYIGTVIVMIAWAFVIQEVIPPVDWAYQARVLLVAPVFFAAALTVSFPVMLLLAFATGFVWDAHHMVPAVGEATLGVGEVPFGYSILLYGLMGTLMQGVRPLFGHGRWGLPVLMIGWATFLLLLFEFLLINFVRGGFAFPDEVWFKILTMALVSVLLAPALLFALYRIARATGYRIHQEGLATRYGR